MRNLLVCGAAPAGVAGPWPDPCRGPAVERRRARLGRQVGRCSGRAVGERRDPSHQRAPALDHAVPAVEGEGHGCCGPRHSRWWPSRAGDDARGLQRRRVAARPRHRGIRARTPPRARAELDLPDRRGGVCRRPACHAHHPRAGERVGRRSGAGRRDGVLGRRGTRRDDRDQGRAGRQSPRPIPSTARARGPTSRRSSTRADPATSSRMPTRRRRSWPRPTTTARTSRKDSPRSTCG